MKLESLHIKNYKLFRDLEIPKLGRVNLITGKNNTGKTILLEALRIWASEGDASVINNIIWRRGDWEPGSELKTYSSLFPNSRVQEKIEIEKLWLISELDNNEKYLDFFGAIEFSDENYWISFLKDRESSNKKDVELLKNRTNRIRINHGDKELPQDKAIFVPASIEFDNKKLWANIDLTDKKDMVIQILRIIEPSIMDLGIIDNVARVRTKDSKTPVPLKNFGEGLNRLLTIAMALVSAEDNLLLIDEIDTGLHHTVLEKLWEIIFEYAEKLDAQVFVTTHSGDCVEAYTAIANQERFKGLGNYFRLQRKRNSEEIIPVFYDENELEIAAEQDIETR